MRTSWSVGLVALAFSVSRAGAQDTIRFDDVPIGAIASPYHGLTWTNWFATAVSQITLDPFHDGGSLTTVSGTQMGGLGGVPLSVDNGHPVALASALDAPTAFSLASGYFRVSDATYSTGQLWITGSLNGVLVFSDAIGVPYGQPAFVALNGAPVDHVTFQYVHSGQNVYIDDLVLATPVGALIAAPTEAPATATTTPDPAALVLLTTGLIGVVPFARRRRARCGAPGSVT